MVYELMCIATAIYFEARGESIAGQIAVAQVILNRVNDPRYPSDACSVVYQAETYPFSNFPIRGRCQFSFYCDGKSDDPKDLKAWQWSQAVAEMVVRGDAVWLVGSSTHYHKTSISPFWAVVEPKTQLDNHIFYEGIK